MTDKEIKGLSDRIRQTAYDIHVYHGQGHLEKVYENAMGHRLRKEGLRAVQQAPVHVYDEDDTLLGEYFADLMVEDEIIIEIKAYKAIAPEQD